MTRKTNVEIITHIMEFSRGGPLAQVFMVEAIRKYAEQVEAGADEIIESMGQGLISGEAWVQTAKTVKAEIDAAYDLNAGVKS